MWHTVDAGVSMLGHRGHLVGVVRIFQNLCILRQIILGHGHPYLGRHGGHVHLIHREPAVLGLVVVDIGLHAHVAKFHIILVSLVVDRVAGADPRRGHHGVRIIMWHVTHIGIAQVGIFH